MTVDKTTPRLERSSALKDVIYDAASDQQSMMDDDYLSTVEEKTWQQGDMQDVFDSDWMVMRWSSVFKDNESDGY